MFTDCKLTDFRHFRLSGRVNTTLTIGTARHRRGNAFAGRTTSTGLPRVTHVRERRGRARGATRRERGRVRHKLRDAGRRKDPRSNTYEGTSPVAPVLYDGLFYEDVLPPPRMAFPRRHQSPTESRDIPVGKQILVDSARGKAALN